MPHRRNFSLFCCALLFTIVTGVLATAQPGIAAPICPPATCSLLQTEFHDLTEEAGLAISYLPAAPAAPLGFLHFEIGAEVSVTAINSDAAYWQAVFSPDNAPSYLPVPKLRARLGLPFGIDVGASYAYVPVIDIKAIGGEIKWAVIKGGTVMPAVAIRGTYSTLLGVSDLNLETYGADLSISKGFAIFTPYLGVGEVWIKSKTSGSLAILNDENITKPRGFVGLQIGIPLISFVAEAAFSSVNTYTARLSVGF